jgi:hypothetical protein
MMSQHSIPKPAGWQWLIIAILAFWLSSSLLLDLVLMPVMAASGMMTEPGFATAGYSIFWIFNRIELLCAAGVLTGTLGLWHNQMHSGQRRSIVLALVLLAVAFVYTYGLSPQMSGLGLSLDLFNPSLETPDGMNTLHFSYWLLEALKLTLGALLLKRWLQPAAALPEFAGR